MARKFEMLIASAMALSVIITIASFIFIFLPYKPLTYHSLSTPLQACEDEEMPVYVDYSISEEEFSTIRRMEVRSNWVAVDVEGVPTGSKELAANAVFEADEISAGRTTREGRAIRSVPEKPGLWHLQTEMKIRGTRLWLPVLQEVEAAADNETLVMPEEEC